MIPKLYETESTPLEQKVIHQRYQLNSVGFYWLIAEYNPIEGLAFGYANLNNDDFAEWGYISIPELKENGVTLDKTWKPCTFKEAKERIREEENRLPVADPQ